MKKFFISAIAVFSALSMSAQERSLVVAPCAVQPGETEFSLNIEAVNEDFDINTITIDIYLPDGFSYIGEEDEGEMSYDMGTTAMMGSRWTASNFNGGMWSMNVNHDTEADADYLRITGFAKSGKYAKNAPGTLFTVPVNVANTVAPGVYPIRVNVVTLVNNKTEKKGIQKKNFYSYVIVGDVEKATVALQGEVSSIVTNALAEEDNVTAVDLSAVTAINGEFAYTVGRAVTAPALTADVKVVAGLNGGTYGSLCSPVALPGVKCYKFTGASGDVATFTEVDNVPANEVVIIDAAVDATVTGATLASVENGNAAAGCLYVAPNGSELRRAKNAVTVPALRGTWDIAGGSNLRIALDTPTGIKMIGTAEEVLGNTYDLQGRQVENAQNGVYVVNGKKQFVK